MTGAQLRRRMLFALLLAFPVLVVCNNVNNYLEGFEQEAGCGKSEIKDFDVTAVAGATRKTSDPGMPSRVSATEGLASVNASATAAKSGGSYLAIDLKSPDDATPASASGSYTTSSLCVKSTDTPQMAVLNLGGPVAGFDGSGPATATATATGQCDDGPIVTWNLAFGGVRIMLPVGSSDAICTFTVTFSAEVANANAFLYLGIPQANVDNDGDRVGEPFDLAPANPMVALPNNVVGVDRQRVGVHLLELGRDDEGPPDFDDRSISFWRLDVLDQPNADVMSKYLADLEEERILAEIDDAAACAVASVDEERCPLVLYFALADATGEPAHAGAWFLADDPPAAPTDFLAPTVIRAMSAEEVRASRLETLDSKIETLGTLELRSSRIGGVFTQEGVAKLAADLSVATGTVISGADLLQNGVAIIELITREGEPSTQPVTLETSSPDFNFFHVAATGSAITALGDGNTSPTGGGSLMITRTQVDTDGSGAVEPDEALTRIASFTASSDEDRWRGGVAVPAGAIAAATEKARLECGGFFEIGARPNDYCILTAQTFNPFKTTQKFFPLQGMGCPPPLAPDEACVPLDAFPRFTNLTVRTPAEDEAIGCNLVEQVVQGGGLCANLSGMSDAIPGTCAIVGGEDCPDLCARVGGLCIGAANDRYCTTSGFPAFGGCTDLSVENVCPENNYCRPYSGSNPTGVLTFPKVACGANTDCFPGMLCGADGICEKGVACDPRDDLTGIGTCAAGQLCLEADDGRSDGVEGNNGRCVDAVSAPCIDDLSCGGTRELCTRANAIPASTPGRGVCRSPKLEKCDTSNDCGSQVCVITEDPTPGGSRGYCVDEEFETCDPDDAAECGPGLSCEPLRIAPWERRVCVSTPAP